MQERQLSSDERNVLEWFFKSHDFKAPLFEALTLAIWISTDTVDLLRRVVLLEDVEGINVMSDEAVATIRQGLSSLLQLEVDNIGEQGKFSVSDFNSFIRHVDDCLNMQYAISLISNALDRYFQRNVIDPYYDLQYILSNIIGYDSQTRQYLLRLIHDSIDKPFTSIGPDRIRCVLEESGLIYLVVGKSIVVELEGLMIDGSVVMGLREDGEKSDIGNISFRVRGDPKSHLLEDNGTEIETNDTKYSISSLLLCHIPLFLRLFVSKRKEREERIDTSDKPE